MASNINPQIIDGNYPVAGQDNDSQGFRDNFTNTKTNFERAAAEITDLQSKVVLKAPLSGTTGNPNNNMNGQVLSNAQLRNMSETTIPLGAVSGGRNIDYTQGSYYSLATSGPVDLSFSGFSTGVTNTLRLQITVSSTADTLTLPAAVGAGISFTSTTYILGWSSNVITFSAAGTYVFEFTTSDGGSTIFIEDLTRTTDFSGQDTFSANGNISLATTSTVITSSANLTGNLAAGQLGQIKILAYGNTSTGNALITVANAAWGGAGTANLSAVGSAATFQYIGGKWFCVGNNGVTFS